MAFDVEQEEQLTAIRDWWRRHKRWVWVGVGVVVITLVGYYAWQIDNSKKIAAASQAYGQFEKLWPTGEGAAKAKLDLTAARAGAEQLQKDYPATAYAWLAALSLAKEAWQQNDKELAVAQLRFALDRATPEYKGMAALNLTSILIGDGKYDEVLKLADPALYPETFAGLMLDRRGDALLAQKKYSEARDAFNQAVPKLAQHPSLKELIEVKIASLPQS